MALPAPEAEGQARRGGESGPSRAGASWWVRCINGAISRCVRDCSSLFFQMSASEESDEMPMPDSESVFVIPGSVLLWRIAPRPPNSAQVRLGLRHGLASTSSPRLLFPCAGPAGGMWAGRSLLGSGAVPAHSDPESQDSGHPVPGSGRGAGVGASDSLGGTLASFRVSGCSLLRSSKERFP